MANGFRLTSDEEDGVLLAAASGQSRPRRALIRLGKPLAPPLAAEADGVDLDFESVLGRLRALAGRADVALVEGAGGLLAPLTWRHTALDLARLLPAPLLLVAADRLGTINHVRLTLAAARAAAIRTLAVVLSAPGVPDSSSGGNAASLERLPGVPPVVTVPRVVGADEAADALEALTRRLWP